MKTSIHSYAREITEKSKASGLKSIAQALTLLLFVVVAGCAGEMPRSDAAQAAVKEEPSASKSQAPPTFIYRPGS